MAGASDRVLGEIELAFGGIPLRIGSGHAGDDVGLSLPFESDCFANLGFLDTALVHGANAKPIQFPVYSHGGFVAIAFEVVVGADASSEVGFAVAGANFGQEAWEPLQLELEERMR